MKKVLVTGASGFLGSSLLHHLAAIGYKVKALVRPNKKSVINNPLIEVVTGDVRYKESFEKDLIGVEQVYHLAGIVTDWAPNSLYEETNVKGTTNILEASVAAGVKRVVHVSTIDVVAYERHDFVDEDTEHTLSTIPYRRTKKTAEELALSYNQKRGLEVVVIRPSWIYGPGDTAFFPEIAYQLKKGSMVFIDNPQNFLPLVYIDNLSLAIIKAGEVLGIGGGVFLISDGEITWKELVDSIANEINTKTAKIRIPYYLAYFFAIIMETMSKIAKKEKRPLLTTGAVEMVGHSIKVNTQKAQKILGYTPTISLEHGLPKTFQWLKSLPH